MAALNFDHLRPLQDQLEGHAIYGAIQRIEDLRIFMQHHVFSVWDFMSLIKYLQRQIAPVAVPWQPTSDPSLRYFINELIQEEESDAIPLGSGEVLYASHFELYCRAMNEIGADGGLPERFLALVNEQGLDKALYSPLVPLPARYFSETTFCFIREDKPHLVAAALTLGRENLIPTMFRQLLDRMGIDETQAPIFHAYLKRHIHLDEDFHGPLSMRLLETLCGDDPERIEEAEIAAEEALCARIRFWDGVLEAIESGRSTQ
ncbi:DUF3050 domain-containing protein [Allochromatium vinosum]|uniref:DUF3050 domain-containing protein n=1 Tax=Allochromatium vinosum (strain ATCC 17899 / DSM 180 / NBRC 103801 / NCIMB 10441 / D) TaxID=572477 RepID=D3RN24_ALLVD|nr:DUF3050 domain-containing protein [Allochromatium vinosum]ADC61308.1 conserved hypothetical protein [Allochromatium vinosum DSM 180]MBK1656058.1 DUF3050 domain-containing protein [Allochromatium vinosum]